MNRFLIYSLFVFVILSFLAILFGQSFIAVEQEFYVDNQVFVDGTPSFYEVPTSNYTFNIDGLTGALIILTGVIILAGVTGIKILGSGLDSESVRIILILTAYITLWSIFSFLSIPLINLIPVFNGVIFIGLTIIYVIGVIFQLQS
jgi:hypothetical protein